MKFSKYILYVRDAAAVVQFLKSIDAIQPTETKRLELVFQGNPMPEWLEINVGGLMVALHSGREAEDVNSASELVFAVPDLDKLMTKCTNHKIKKSKIFSPYAGKRVVTLWDQEENRYSFEEIE